jgi:trans-2,3-dihydro-3-hydroxyanthranilate isomerase
MSMREVEFVQIDVFTDRPFAGNQLAVFLDGRGVSTQEMQTIAREMNFSESTFILPPSTRDSHAQLRIFSTTKEMPMAGHPVVGTALVLYELQRMGAGRYIFDLAVGPVEVFVEVEKTVPTIWMNQGLASFGAMWSDRQGLAGALGLGLGDLADLPIQIVSTGVPYLIVPIRDLGSLRKTHCNQGALRSALASMSNYVCTCLRR